MSNEIEKKFKTEQEREDLINQHSDKYLVREHINLSGEKSLIFDDTPPERDVRDILAELDARITALEALN